MPPALSLPSLPSELRKLIVSFLVPPLDALGPGSKNDLKNANLTHRCLSEWVPEHMFKEMCLEHVAVGMASHLERLSVERGMRRVRKYVKVILVKVPPAIRWEIGMGEDLNNLDDITIRRLYRIPNRTTAIRVTDAQRAYADEFHRALVEPFIDNRRWFHLLRDASRCWRNIFRSFPNLQEIVIGCCERLEHPKETDTAVFVTKYGRDVNLRDEIDPPFVEDATVNMGWASSIVLQNIPPGVKGLHLTIANMDNLNSYATVNRLPNLIFRSNQWLDVHPPVHITNLSVTVRGVVGVHGDLQHMSGAGSAPVIRHWIEVLSSLISLRRLEFREDPLREYNRALSFSYGRHTNTEDHILRHILHSTRMAHIDTLQLTGFLIDAQCLRETLTSNETLRFDTIVLEDVQMMEAERHDGSDDELGKDFEFLRGWKWFALYTRLSQLHPRSDLWLTRPVSNYCGAENYRLHDKYARALRKIARMHLDIDGT
ncbi:hypothetical protein P280DRAFT_317180 [Massarina eburnea CBS 473.64]|uniref:Uncharacterized protein n=1 Tax=Massarina eburnea CBS 473.64 TaxID=1395130 RepID=A0A6A6S3B7_9PLEO|nr:hypothetical protein P280DRAFT_317180 [Massarina eburnea CBS 473.64]